MLFRNPVRKRVLATGSGLPFSAKSFDRSICRQGLQYLDLKKVIPELVRVSKNSIALGNITMVDERDRQFWAEYFAIASPGRMHVFAPGDLGRLLIEHGLDLSSMHVFQSRGSLYGPIRHLRPPDMNRIRALFDDQDIANRYVVSASEDGNLEYIQRWEFAVGTLK
jgi:hypothetical protein